MTGKAVDFSFDPTPLALEDVQRIAADMWSDLAFDEATLARLKRDGLALDSVRLTGPSPFLLTQEEGCRIAVSIASFVGDPNHAAMLLDLWRVHFMKGLRPGSVAV
jgi:hypothetical protein